MPVFAASEATSAVVLITAPVVYPNKDNMGVIIGVNIAMNVFIALLI
jgi:hypothetical protein